MINDSTIGGLSSVLARTLPQPRHCLAEHRALQSVARRRDRRGIWARLAAWPKLDAIELPNAFFLAFTASLLASFLPGIVGLVATGLAGALLFAYVLQGLAVLHAFSRGMPFRGLLLAAVYIGILLLAGLPSPSPFSALPSPCFVLRDRAATHGQPPNPD